MSLKSKLEKFTSPSAGLVQPIYYRPNTYDMHIIERLLVLRDEYKFPVLSPKIIFDIGANIGAATLLLNQLYPKAVIHCFEPDRENYDILRMNTEHLGDSVVLNNVALSNVNGNAYLYGPEDATNRGAYSLHLNGKTEGSYVPIIRTAFYMARVGTPEIIKIDCEGSEYDILTDISDIHKVHWIAGELHNVREFELLSYLNDKGFDLELRRGFGNRNWPFHAASKEKFEV